MILHKRRGLNGMGLYLALMLAVAASTPMEGFAQGTAGSTAARPDMSLSEQVADLKAKVAKLEIELQRKKAGTDVGSSTGMQSMKGMGQGTSAAMQGSAASSGMGKMNADQMPGQSGAPSMMHDMGAMMQEMGGMMQKMSSMGGKGGMGSMGEMAGMGGMAGGAQSQNAGMAGMGPGGMMDSMMGMAPAQSMATSAALPGFPGASHLYHVGASDFFLDHAEHITLGLQQLSALNAIKEKALLGKADMQRKIDAGEQELWVLTSSDQPDAAKIEAKVGEIEKLRGGQRLAFIRYVGEAAKVLTDEQRQSLLGFKPAQPAPSAPSAMPGMPGMPAAPAGGAGGGGMSDM